MRKPGPFKKNDTKKRRESVQNFQYMVSDVQGPFPVSRDGYRYCVHFTCVKSGWSFVHFMTKRDDISSCWRVTISDIKKFCHGRLPERITLRSDNAGEYDGGQLKELCDSESITQHYSSAYLHEHNAEAEVFFRNISNTGRSLLMTGQVDAQVHAVWLKNRMPNSTKDWSIPYFSIYGKLPNMSQCRFFGSNAYSWIDDKLRGTLDNKSSKYKYVGHTDDSSAFVLLNPMTGAIKHAGRPIIHENFTSCGSFMADATPGKKYIDRLDADYVDNNKPFPFRTSPGDVSRFAIVDHRAYLHQNDKEVYGAVCLRHSVSGEKFWMDLRQYLSTDLNVERMSDIDRWNQFHSYMERTAVRGGLNPYYPVFSFGSTKSDLSDVLTPSCVIVSIDPNNDAQRYGVVHHPDSSLSPSDIPGESITFQFERTLVAVAQGDHRDPLDRILPPPRNYKHSKLYPDAAAWDHAFSLEMNNMVRKGVLTPENPPVGQAAKGIRVETLNSKEVLRYKYQDEFGLVDKRKVRLCARGDCQLDDTYGETFSPSVQLKSVRILLALAAIWSLSVHHFDVTAAFLNSDLTVDNIWLKLPDGWDGFGPDIRYAKVHKSMYGLKQAGRDWFDLQEKWLLSYDSRIKKSSIEHCLYYLWDETAGVHCFILVQVDDYITAYNDSKFYADFYTAYSKRF